MARKRDNTFRPWPFIGAAVVCFTSGTALLSTEEGRTAAGEALIIMGILLIGSWIVLLSAQSPIEAVRGWREIEKDKESEPRPPNEPPNEDESEEEQG
jgi:hypothetical protein